MKGFDWSETYATLVSFGLTEATATHYTSVLCKWDSFNFCPDIEVRGYMSRLFHYLQTPHEQQWNELSYDAVFFLWQPVPSARQQYMDLAEYFEGQGELELARFYRNLAQEY